MKAFILSCLVAATPNYALGAERWNAIPTRNHVIERLEAGDNRTLAADALEAIFQRSAHLLMEKGRKDVADDLLKDWHGFYLGVVLFGPSKDMGDHKPLSQWLADAYAKIEGVLGPEVCDFFHLSDINIINFTIPVTFDPHEDATWCVEHQEKLPEASCEPEYRRHFAGTKWQKEDDDGATARLHFGFAPVVTYWIVFAACEAATWGTDGTLLCSPIAGLSEIAIARYVAPPVSQKIWDHYNP